MAERFGARLAHAWNAFRDSNRGYQVEYGGTSSNYAQLRMLYGGDQSILSTIQNRIALDAAAADIKHVRLDEEGNYLEDIQSALNRCLTLAANTDQTARALIQDLVLSAMDEGVVALVPVDTSVNPFTSGGFDVHTLRVGKIINWHPQHVEVRLYNENTGERENVILEKKFVAIVENPLYVVMNKQNSTFQRLKRKLALLDETDEKVGSGKLDLIIQLPYVAKSEIQKDRAEKSRKRIEEQLAKGPYGIAYADGTEKIIQLNRPVENNLQAQIEYLTNMVFNQLGLTMSVFDGTADEATMLNYQNRTIGPFLFAIVDAIRWKFLTQTARTQRQSIMFFIDSFKFIPMSELANLGDRLTRNEIITSNEMRSKIGMKPSKDPKANELRNKNIAQKIDEGVVADNSQNDALVEEVFASLEAELDKLISETGGTDEGS